MKENPANGLVLDGVFADEAVAVLVCGEDAAGFFKLKERLANGFGFVTAAAVLSVELSALVVVSTAFTEGGGVEAANAPCGLKLINGFGGSGALAKADVGC